MLNKHDKLERNSIVMILAIIVVVSIGGLVEAVPLFRKETVIEPVEGVRPYTPLELAGFNIYVREGCYLCHSQQIRALRDEVARYGHYSLAAESMYDRPFQWGSKRTGPDLARVGGKYSDEWHREHMVNPRNVVPESIMPSYPFLAEKKADIFDMKYHLKAQAVLGTPYTSEMVENGYEDAVAQATPDGDTSGFEGRYPTAIIRDFDGNPDEVTELDALIAYLQVLGTMADLTDYRPLETSNSQKN